MCIVCGTIGFAAYYLLLHDKVTAKKKEDTSGSDHPDGNA